MTDDNEQAAASAAAETTQVIKPEDGQIKPEGQQAGPEGDEDDEGEGAEEGQPKRQSRTARYKARIERLEAQLAAQTVAPPRQPRSLDELSGPRPQLRDYGGSVSDYQAALAGWEADRRSISRDLKNQAAEAERRAALETEFRASSYAEKQAEARAVLPDYDKVVGAAQIPVSVALAAALTESELTARLEYHLAKNPETLAKLNRMSPSEAARAVGRLEERLSAAPQNRTTQAPAPLNRLSGGTAGPVKTLAELARGEDASDYIAARRAERAKQSA